jgi:transcriptional regulator
MLRAHLRKTQVEVARAAKMSQPEVSATEKRADHLVSTLRRYVKALGGEIEVNARFGDVRIQLKGR